MRSILTGILLLLSWMGFGQYRLPLPVCYQSINAGSRQQADVFAQLQQPAALTALRRPGAGLYSRRRFMLAELTQAGLAVASPFGKQVAGLAVQYLGGQAVRQSEAALSVARQLGPLAAVGLQFSYRNHRVLGYREQVSLGYALGARLQLTEQVQALVAVANPEAVSRIDFNRHAARYEVGVGADLSENLYLGCSIGQVAGRGAGVQAGVQYRIVQSLFCRLGLSTATHEFIVGAGYMLHGFRLDLFTTLHTQLGFSPGLQLVYQPQTAK